jgi:UDP-N-acetyl-D-mannosaminuronate dehydrogenase
VDFKLGYSPERINPGDKDHPLERIVKVVAGQDEDTLARLVAVYGAIVEAGIHEAPSIKVAEAAKVIENTQRDVNIALMNEISKICELAGIRSAMSWRRRAPSGISSTSIRPGRRSLHWRRSLLSYAKAQNSATIQRSFFPAAA